MVPVMTYTNSRGQSITFRNHAPYMMETYSGTGGSAVDVQTQKAPFQDGETHIDTMMDGRSIFLQVVLIGKTHEGMLSLRREVSQVFNPKLEGVLRYESAIGTYEIAVVPDGAPEYPGGDSRGNHWQRTVVSLFAPDPYWQSEEMHIQGASYEPLFEFEHPDGTEFGDVTNPDVYIEMGIQSTQRTIVNGGDVDSPVVITIEAKGEALVNPEVENLTTGQTLAINGTIADGEKLTIESGFGRKRIELDGVNRFDLIALDSVFWQLTPGENIVEISSDSGTGYTYVYWRNRFVGI